MTAFNTTHKTQLKFVRFGINLFKYKIQELTLRPAHTLGPRYPTVWLKLSIIGHLEGIKDFVLLIIIHNESLIETDFKIE